MQATTEALFQSAHDALLFAYNHGAQSPRSPLAGLAPRTGQLGKGRGLAGFDGAAQAGIILAVCATLAPDHHRVLRVRFGRNEQPCPHCQTIASCAEWIEAVDALSRTPDLEGVQRPSAPFAGGEGCVRNEKHECRHHRREFPAGGKDPAETDERVPEAHGEARVRGAGCGG